MNKEELNHVFKNKTWNEIKTKDSWQLFKIMSEFVNGFEKMSKIGPCVSIFGSARTKNDNQYISWIDTYFSEEYQELCKSVGEMLDQSIIDRLGNNFENNIKWPKLCKTFQIATKLEINFWEMSLKLE